MTYFSVALGHFRKTLYQILRNSYASFPDGNRRTVHTAGRRILCFHFG